MFEVDGGMKQLPRFDFQAINGLGFSQSHYGATTKDEVAFSRHGSFIDATRIAKDRHEGFVRGLLATIYGQAFTDRIDSLDIEEITTAPYSPWQNPYCERVIGSIRRDAWTT